MSVELSFDILSNQSLSAICVIGKSPISKYWVTSGSFIQAIQFGKCFSISMGTSRVFVPVQPYDISYCEWSFWDERDLGLFCGLFCGLYLLYYALFEFDHENKWIIALVSLGGTGIVAGLVSLMR